MDVSATHFELESAIMDGSYIVTCDRVGVSRKRQTRDARRVWDGFQRVGRAVDVVASGFCHVGGFRVCVLVVPIPMS